MTKAFISYRTATGLVLALAATAWSLPAHAQIVGPMGADEVADLPPEYRSGPIFEDVTETVLDENGVEVITRTRRIETVSGAPVQPAQTSERYAQPGYPVAYAPYPAVFDREQWIDECERRIDGRSDDEQGGIIGGLLGAIAGGIIGNRVSAGERLAGTLIGAGTGGLAGLLIGSLIGGGRDEDGDYDCEAALDGYLSQYAYGGPRVAARTIPAPYPAYAPQAPGYYGYGYAPSYQYSYAPPQQIVYVPIEYQQQQRVIVRETVREELVPVEGASRAIPAPAPVPVRAPTPAPPRYIKDN